MRTIHLIQLDSDSYIRLVQKARAARRIEQFYSPLLLSTTLSRSWSLLARTLAITSRAPSLGLVRVRPLSLRSAARSVSFLAARFFSKFLYYHTTHTDRRGSARLVLTTCFHS